MSQVVYTHYNGLLVEHKEGVHHELNFKIDGLTDDNANQILTKIFREIGTNLPIFTLTYELGNVFTLTLNLASHKYVVYNITIAKKQQIKYALNLVSSYALEPYTAIATEDEDLNAKENIVNFLNLLAEYGLGFTPVIIYAGSWNDSDELKKFKDIMTAYASLAPRAFFITNRGYRPNEIQIDGFSVSQSSGYFSYINTQQIMVEDSELYLAMLSNRMVKDVNQGKEDQYIEFISSIVSSALNSMDLDQERKDLIISSYKGSEARKHLLRAVTTSDYSTERPEDEKDIDYEVYEMLGDRVWEVNFVRYLKVRFPKITPEQLTNIKIYFMSKNRQQRLALEIGLSYFILSGFKTTDIKLYEDILESLAEAIVVVGNQVVPGLGMEIHFNVLADIFNRIDINVNDKRYKPAKTYVKEVMDKAGLPRVKQSSVREETTVVITLQYPINLKSVKMTGTTLTINERDRTIVSSARSNEEAETKAYEVLREMLINAGYTLERYSGLLPQGIKKYEAEFMKIQRKIRAQDFSIRTTKTEMRGASIGVSGVIDFLIDGKWVNYVSSIGQTQPECLEKMMKLLMIITERM